MAGEWTPSYMLHAWVPPLLRRAAPEARLLVLLRDPVARFRSGRRGDEDLRLGMTARAAANASFSRGLYADQLLRLWSAFPPERVLVLQYERCLREAQRELRRTYAFLGLDPDVADHVDVNVQEAGSDPAVGAGLDERQADTLGRAYAPENERLAGLLPDLDLDLWTWRAPRSGRRA
jgi:hypothetical protein